jgi:hypothetical protein
MLPVFFLIQRDGPEARPAVGIVLDPFQKTGRVQHPRSWMVRHKGEM